MYSVYTINLEEIPPPPPCANRLQVKSLQLVRTYGMYEWGVIGRQLLLRALDTFYDMGMFISTGSEDHHIWRFLL